MKFRVIRTSSGSIDDPPCEEAIREVFNHYSFTPGNPVTKEFSTFGWYVEIKDLNELIAFSKKYGEIVFGQNDAMGSNGFEIEIYDNYREC